VLNRLVAVKRKADGGTEETLIARYTYDEAGFRIKKDSMEKGVTWYVFSAGGSVLYEEKGDGEYKEFVYAFGRHFAKVEGKLGGDGSERKKYFYHTDHLGSTVAVTNAAGEVVWRNDYTPFGGLTGEYGTEEHDAKYTGKDLDTETGLYYFNARWYDAGLGRFISQDPIKNGVNWYAYCNSNPLIYTDPSGLERVVDAYENQRFIKERASKPEDRIIDLHKRVSKEAQKRGIADAKTYREKYTIWWQSWQAINADAIDKRDAKWSQMRTEALENDRYRDAYFEKVDRFKACRDALGPEYENLYNDAEYTQMMLGAIGGVLTWLENEDVRGNSHTFDEINAYALEYIEAKPWADVITGAAIMGAYAIQANGTSIRQTFKKVTAKLNGNSAEGAAGEEGNLLYQNARPKYANGQVEQVWKNAQDVNGRVYDPNTGEELFWDTSRSRDGQWDMGHIPEAKYSELYKKYSSGQIDLKTFLEEYRNPSNYRPESPSANRSHLYE